QELLEKTAASCPNPSSRVAIVLTKTIISEGDADSFPRILFGDGRCPLMGWSGRAPAPPASEAGKGRQNRGARHVPASQHDDRRNGRRYREELVPCRRPRSARSHCPAAEVVAWPGRIAAGQHAALPDWDGGLRRGASSQSQAQGSWSRCPVDAGEVRSPVFEGPEERLPRRGGNRRGGATSDDEVRGNEDRRSARPTGAASGA